MTEQFMAVCGHMTTAKRLGQICPECYLNTHSELAKLKQEVKHWKSNHDTRVEAARFLIERTDLPIERIQAYEAFLKLKQENCDLKERLEAYEQLIQSIETVVIKSIIPYNDYNE